jgi:class 3 adenylate cyclase
VMTDDAARVLKDIDSHEWRPHPMRLTAYDAGAHAAQLELAIQAEDRGQVAAGQRLFDDLHARGVAYAVDWPCLVPRVLAEAALCLGQVERAAEWVDLAERTAEATGARTEIARLAVIRARMLLDSAEDESVHGAVDLIDRATAEFDALGMLRAARQAQQLFDLPRSTGAAMRRLRPRTVLFTDIVDSTAWNVRLGDTRWLLLLAEHNRRARQEVRRRRGVVVKTTGDGICAWFPEPTDAVDCAESLQRSFAEFGNQHPDTPIGIRCGIAVGDVYDFDGDLAGLAVTEAARICAVATSGQVVTSDAVARLDHQAHRSYRDIGAHRLKGLPDELTLFALETHRH